MTESISAPARLRASGRDSSRPSNSLISARSKIPSRMENPCEATSPCHTVLLSLSVRFSALPLVVKKTRESALGESTRRCLWYQIANQISGMPSTMSMTIPTPPSNPLRKAETAL